MIPTLQSFYLWSRKIHRFLVVLMVILGLIMLVTGSAMKYDAVAAVIDPIQSRLLHNFTSAFFAPVFLAQLLTGGYMYLHPYLLKWFRKPSPPPVVPPKVN